MKENNKLDLDTLKNNYMIRLNYLKTLNWDELPKELLIKIAYPNKITSSVEKTKVFALINSYDTVILRLALIGKEWDYASSKLMAKKIIAKYPDVATRCLEIEKYEFVYSGETLEPNLKPNKIQTDIDLTK